MSFYLTLVPQSKELSWIPNSSTILNPVRVPYIFIPMHRWIKWLCKVKLINLEIYSITRPAWQIYLDSHSSLKNTVSPTTTGNKMHSCYTTMMELSSPIILMKDYLPISQVISMWKLLHLKIVRSPLQDLKWTIYLLHWRKTRNDIPNANLENPKEPENLP